MPSPAEEMRENAAKVCRDESAIYAELDGPTNRACVIALDHVACHIGYIPLDPPQETVVTDAAVTLALQAWDTGVGDPNDYRRRMRAALEAVAQPRSVAGESPVKIDVTRTLIDQRLDAPAPLGDEGLREALRKILADTLGKTGWSFLAKRVTDDPSFGAAMMEAMTAAYSLSRHPLPAATGTVEIGGRCYVCGNPVMTVEPIPGQQGTRAACEKHRGLAYGGPVGIALSAASSPQPPRVAEDGDTLDRVYALADVIAPFLPMKMISGPAQRQKRIVERQQLAIEIARSALSATRPVVDGWQPIETAPKDGTLLLLIVSSEEEHGQPLEDANPSRTIGFNNFDNDCEDVWKMAGWNWESDYFTEQTNARPEAWQLFPSHVHASPPADTSAQSTVRCIHGKTIAERCIDCEQHRPASAQTEGR